MSGPRRGRRRTGQSARGSCSGGVGVESDECSGVHEKLAETAVLLVGAVAPVHGVGRRQGRNLAHPANDWMPRRQTPQLPFNPGADRAQRRLLAVPRGVLPASRSASLQRLGAAGRAGRYFCPELRRYSGTEGIVRSRAAVAQTGRLRERGPAGRSMPGSPAARGNGQPTDAGIASRRLSRRPGRSIGARSH